VRVSHFEHEGFQLAFEEYGEGDRVVVFLHGLLLDATLNRGIATSLEAGGYRVLLLDLLGHGGSDRPRHATHHRMDHYADQVVGLLDHLGIESAVVGGVSLGANVSLHVAAQHPDRVTALIVEMPVLEWATPAAALIFVPLLLGIRALRPVLAFTSGLIAKVPRTGIDPLDGVIRAVAAHPDEAAAVLHGLLVGPIAPSIERRRQIDVPALVLGHGRDLIHPFSDARNLAEDLPRGRLVEASSILEMRLRPTRLMAELVDFLDSVHGVQPGRVVRLPARA